MSSPCNNCGADFRVCAECDFHNGKYIEKSVIDDIKAEIEQTVNEEADEEKWSRGLHYALKIIDKHTVTKAK